MIEIKNVKKSFKNKQVLDGITFNLEKGNVYGLLGNNGAGKTTLMRGIFNMVNFDEGTVTYDGVEQDKINYKKWFYFTETDTLPLDLTVIQYFKKLTSLAEIKNNDFKKRLDMALKIVNINFKLNQKIKKLSSGQQKIMNCIAMILVKPDVLFLDEPTANMDVKNQKIILDVIDFLKNENRIIVITSHLIKEINGFITNAIIIDSGKVKFNKAIHPWDNLQNIFNANTTSENINKEIMGEYFNE